MRHHLHWEAKVEAATPKRCHCCHQWIVQDLDKQKSPPPVDSTLVTTSNINSVYTLSHISLLLVCVCVLTVIITILDMSCFCFLVSDHLASPPAPCIDVHVLAGTFHIWPSCMMYHALRREREREREKNILHLFHLRPVHTWARLNPYQSHTSMEVWHQMWSTPSIDFDYIRTTCSDGN